MTIGAPTFLTALGGRSVVAGDETTFLRTYGHLFEHSQWVVERAWALGPFADAAALRVAFQQVIEAAGEGEQLALARAHPELADKLAIADIALAVSGARVASFGKAFRKELMRRRFREYAKRAFYAATGRRRV